ncbi:MAG TPA: hypothetical protein VMS17_19225 [Gemmataceae bacterium]|nr:hypothetical protein [Gemmataceae bacterium]
MRKTVQCAWVLLAAVGLVGCNSSADVAPDAPPPDAPPPPPARLQDQTDVNLADWLKKPRPELAQLVAEWTETVQKQRLHAAENPVSLDLLPALQPSATMPVFGQATYSAAVGVSLPTYVKSGAPDGAVALHLARLGDRDAALLLADKADKDLFYRIDARRTDRNYPVEWTQLTALAFQSAEWKLAGGQTQAATDLVQLHKQLQTLLDGKAAAGPLGAVLLPLGRRALIEAAVAWKQPQHNQPELAQDLEAALKDWGESPPPAPALAPGASEFEAVRLFGRPAAGQAVVADQPEGAARALDLLELPVPADGAQVVAAFFDADRRLTETLVVYQPKLVQTFPDVANLAGRLIDSGLPGSEPVKGVGLTRRTFTGDGLTYETVLVIRGGAAGGFVRVSGAKPPGALPDAARDFGAVRLDCTFEQNRVLFARDKTGPAVDLDCRQNPGVVHTPIADPTPDFARLEREGNRNLTASLTLEWPPDEIGTAVPNLAAPLLAAYGSPHIDGVQDANGDYLALAWEDARTQLTLRLPYETNPIVFRAENRPGAESADARLAKAAAADVDARQKRLGTPKQRTCLPRTLEIPEIHLGMTKKQVIESLPQKDSVELRNLNNDRTLIFKADPLAAATYGVRQMYLRFGADDRLAEIRARYDEGPAKPDDQHKSLLQVLKAAGGEPQTLPAPWAALWPELAPQQPKPALYRWFDDATVLTLQRDGGGAEAILRDWPPGTTLDQVGCALRPLRFCEDGAAGLALGMTRAAVMQKFPNARPLQNEDGLDISTPADPNYLRLLVWFDAGAVVRVVAQHKTAPTNAADIAAKLNDAQSHDFDHLGARRRVDGANGVILQAYGFHDDQVRVRIFAQQMDDGPHLFSEWRYWQTAK